MEQRPEKEASILDFYSTIKKTILYLNPLYNNIYRGFCFMAKAMIIEPSTMKQ